MTNYKDINFSFSKNSFTSDLSVVEDSTAIKQSIKNILLSFSGEKSFRPKFGGELQKLIFESSNLADTTVVLDLIETLNSYEPRIKVKTIIPSYSGSGQLKLKINYDYFFGGQVIQDTALVSLDSESSGSSSSSSSSTSSSSSSY